MLIVAAGLLVNAHVLHVPWVHTAASRCSPLRSWRAGGVCLDAAADRQKLTQLQTALRGLEEDGYDEEVLLPLRQEIAQVTSTLIIVRHFYHPYY